MTAEMFLDWQTGKMHETLDYRVKENGIALEFTSEPFKADKSIVLTAVTQNGYALEFASPELKADKEIVMAAVTQEDFVIRFASEELKTDSDIINSTKRDYKF